MLIDGQPPCRPSNKHHHHGGTVCRDSGMAMANQPVLPPGASLERVGRGRCVRVLFNLADRPIKINYETQQFILDLSILFAPYCHQNDAIAPPP